MYKDKEELNDTQTKKKKSIEQVGAWTGDPGTLYGVKSTKACLELDVGRADKDKKTSRDLSSKRKKM